MEKLEVIGSSPPPRFGHTITSITKGKAILFGGATGDTGKYAITALGTSPSPRAAHAAVAVEANQMVIYGGATGGGSLATDDLFLLDIRNGEDNAQWTLVPVIGTTPGRRYGHTITYCKPFLIVFGGNTGSEPVNDVWVLNVEKAPFSWAKIECKSESPVQRVYHSASLCTTGNAQNMIVIFGGRSHESVAMNDTWGLRRHRDGRWDWVKAPQKLEKDGPIGRYQHTSLFIGTLLLIVGGRTNNVGETVGLDIYDTETSEWYKYPAIQRFRHSSWTSDANIYIYGGLLHESPNVPTDQVIKINLVNLFQNNSHLLNQINQYSPASSRSISPQLPSYQNSLNTSYEKNQKNQSQNSITFQEKTSYLGNNNNNNQNNNNNNGTMNPMKNGNSSNSSSTNSSFNNKNDKNFRISDHIIVNDQAKKVSGQGLSMNKLLIQNQMNNESQIHLLFLNTLLQPKTYINLSDNVRFNFKPEQIILLCNAAQKVIEGQSMVLKVRAPIKIYGDIHGQYSDLMRFFDLWGAPCDNLQEGDIESFDYLFLGDYVDRGSHSLETICLLLALKIRFPDQIHLLRGNHEDRWINNGFGFSEECATRLGEDPDDEDSIFNRVNLLFDWLPLAAIIEDKIICLHGGIGSTLNYIEEIESLQRPLEVIHEVSTIDQQLVVDILWSDPTDNDSEIGIHANTIRDPNGTGNIVKFGPDRVQQFLDLNNLSMIIRAHECVMDGFERFAAGALITVFSATDYCQKHKNAGAVLILKKNFEITPKLIYPSSTNVGNWIDDEESLKKRPPTPPRWKNALPRKSSYD